MSRLSAYLRSYRATPAESPTADALPSPVLATGDHPDDDQPLVVQESDFLTERVETVLFALTSNCNLRCTYCAVSLPSYVGSNFDLPKLDALARQMAAAGVELVQVSGHGETTILPNWAAHCRHFLDRGIAVCITSNFSNVFSDEEIDVLARMKFINVSIDTVDRELLKRLRRKVDLKTILYNMQNVRLRAKLAYGRDAAFSWQCTLSDAVIGGLVDWVQMGILYGVKHFTLGNLIEHRGLPDSPKHVAKLSGSALKGACDTLRRARDAAAAARVGFQAQPGILEGINEALTAEGINEAFFL
jgi:pyruvate-formate lyase-activating enzyme